MLTAEQEQIERLSESLLLAAPSDIQELAGFHTQFQEIAAWALQRHFPSASQVSRKAADVIEQVILGEAVNPQQALDDVCQAAAFIQSVVCAGKNPGDLPLPDAFKIAETMDENAGDLPDNGNDAAGDNGAAPKGAHKTSDTTTGQGSEPSSAESNMFANDPELMAEFIQEAREHLEAADVHLLTLETEPDNEEALNAVFRAFHTLKGNAGFLALPEIQCLAHEAESLLDRARKRTLQLEGKAMDVAFDAVDALKGLVGQISERPAPESLLAQQVELERLRERLRAIAEGSENETKTAEMSDDAEVAEGMKLGEILVETGVATESAVEHALQEQQATPQPKRLGEILVEHVATSSHAVQEALEIQRNGSESRKIGEIMVELGSASPEAIDAALECQQRTPENPKLGELLVRAGEAPAKDVARSLRSQQQAGVAGEHMKESVKVDAARLDRLIDAIGEMVIAESMVSQSQAVLQASSPELARHLAQLDKITRELQEMGMSLRMVPIRPAFQRMARLARDLAKKSGKQVEFVTRGEDTELDKTVVDKIGDPLVHMVRNAIDHGIEESEAARIAAGKAPAGRVELRAFHKGGNIHIEVEDDGCGLDRERILAKALERGLIREGEILSDREAYNLIFEPGFSTAKTVTDVSGRGVGMDVVRRNVEALRGQVEIRSEKGKGGLFSIRLPLTLAIIDGMVVRVGSERYVLPTLSIVTSLRPNAKNVSTVVQRGEMLTLQEQLIPMLRLGRLFHVLDAEEEMSQCIAVVVEAEGRRAALVVDEIIGQQQIVIKSLGETMQGIPAIAGGAIMGDGRVGLIVDVSGLMRVAKETPSEDVQHQCETKPGSSGAEGEATP